jgi:glycosyltransferase involved in cell wall biosynthesis
MVAPGCPVYYLPNAINLNAYRAVGKERTGMPMDRSPLRVFYLGYLGKAKGSFDLVEAAKEVLTRNIPVIFDLVGGDWTPGETEQLRMQIDQAGLGNIVTLHPPVMGAKKIDFFREADIFIYPSYSEGMPIAVIEAMACGLPIIATRVGGLPDLVIDGFNGVLVDVGCPDQLVDALEYLNSNPDLRFMMQMNSNQSALDKYDIEKLVPRLINIYRKALTGISY